VVLNSDSRSEQGVTCRSNNFLSHNATSILLLREAEETLVFHFFSFWILSSFVNIWICLIVIKSSENFLITFWRVSHYDTYYLMRSSTCKAPVKSVRLFVTTELNKFITINKMSPLRISSFLVLFSSTEPGDGSIRSTKILWRRILIWAISINTVARACLLCQCVVEICGHNQLQSSQRMAHAGNVFPLREVQICINRALLFEISMYSCSCWSP